MAKKNQPTKSIKGYIVAAVIIIASIGILGMSIWGNAFALIQGHVLKVNGEKVSAGTMRYHFALNSAGYDSILGEAIDDEGTTVADYIFEQTVDEIIYNVLCSQKAKELGINYTAEDEFEAGEAVKEFKELVTADTMKYIGLSDEKLKKIYLDTVLTGLIYEYYTKDFVVNEASFDEYFINYYDTNRSTLVSMFGDYVATDSLEKAEALIERVLAGEALNDLAAEYNCEERETFETVSIGSPLPQEVIDAAVLYSEGDLTEAIEIKLTNEDGEEMSLFYVVSLVKVVEPVMDTLKAEQRETYITEQKNTIFGVEYGIWREELTLEYNQAVLSMLRMQGAVTKESEAQAQQEAEATEAPAEGNESGE